MSEVKIRPISEASYYLGEGPHWDEEDQTLLFVDIPSGQINRYFLESQTIQKAYLEDIGTGNAVSFIIPVVGEKDLFVIGLGTSLALIKWSPREPDNQIKRPILVLSLHSSQVQRVRFNDAKCDDKGRLYAGTMDTDFAEKHEKYLGNLYSIDSNVKITRLVKDVSISNGLAWSKDNKTLYYIDSMEFRIDAFDYSFETGDISNRRPVFEYKAHMEVKGKPDGMTIDENGNLWVACFNGFQLLNIDPRKGKLLRIIDMPSRNITSCCFGGPDYSTMFVTSARKGCDNEIGKYPDTGKTFIVTGLGVKGLPPNKFKANNISTFLKS